MNMGLNHHTNQKHRIADRVRSFANRNQDRRPITDILEIKLNSRKATLVDAFDQAVNDLSDDRNARRQLTAVIRFHIHSD